MLHSILSVALGAALGALLRWQLGERLNALFPLIPLGTLASNLIGGYAIGVFIAVFGYWSTLSPEWRLFLITGFCGGLTTFSSFSVEIFSLFNTGRLFFAFSAIALHLLGSLAMTFLGIASVGYFYSK